MISIIRSMELLFCFSLHLVPCIISFVNKLLFLNLTADYRSHKYSLMLLMLSTYFSNSDIMMCIISCLFCSPIRISENYRLAIGAY